MATTEIYTLSLHDALPILVVGVSWLVLDDQKLGDNNTDRQRAFYGAEAGMRSEEHTSELQSLRHLVCRLLLEKKNLRLPQQEQKPDQARHRHHWQILHYIS